MSIKKRLRQSKVMSRACHGFVEPMESRILFSAVANFTAGMSSTDVDGWPGKAGSGWGTAWAAKAVNANFTTQLHTESTPSLLNNGTFMQATLTATAANGTGSLSRQYVASTGVSLSAIHEIGVDFRYDSGTMHSTGDAVTIFGDNAADSGTGPTNTWAVAAYGGAVGSIPAYTFVVDSGTSPVPTNIVLHSGDVYRIIVDPNPQAYTYTATVADLTAGTSWSSGTLSFRETTMKSTGYLNVAMTASAANETEQFSYDVVDVSGPNLAAAPTALTAVQSASNSVALNWASDTSHRTSYTISRSLDGVNNWTPVQTGVNPNATSYTDTSVSTVPDYYQLLAVNEAGSQPSTAVDATTFPIVTTNPISQTVIAGQPVTFTAHASANPSNDPNPQWYYSTNSGQSFSPLYNGSGISGANSTSLTISPTTTSENGYEYEAKFTDAASSAMTTAATLTVNPSALSGTVSTAGSSYNLTSQGFADWAHWGDSDGVANGYADQGTGAGQISNVTPYGSGGVSGSYTDPIVPLTWTDGNLADPAQSGDNNFIWENVIGAGWTFTVPADTTSRTLYVLAGGYEAANTLSAHLSDGSSPDYVAPVESSSGLYRDLYAITYHAASAGQTLTITLAQSQDLSGSGNGSVNLAGAWLTDLVGAAPTITTPPVNETVTAGSPVTFTAVGTGNPAPSVTWNVNKNDGTGFNPISNGNGYSNAGTTALTLSSTTAAENGYQYEAVFINPSGSVTTTPATLNVQYAPVITPPQPTSVTVAAGGNATFTAAASANPAVTGVQWKQSTNGGSTFSALTDGTAADGTVVAGSVTGTLTLSNVAADLNTDQYEAVFTNSIGSTPTSAATLTVSNPAAGSLSGSASLASPSYDLTTPGTTDWAHWGDPNGFADEATGGGQISNVTQYSSPSSPSGSYGSYNNDIVGVAWSDGNSPDQNQNADINYIWQNGVIGAGWTFTVPADATSRTLYVLAGGNNSTCTLLAHLSDGSHPDYSVTESSTGQYENLYTITYNASASSSPNQNLTITLTQTGGSGSVDLAAARLVGPTVISAPAITQQPTNQPYAAGATVTFAAAASGNPATTSVQWYQVVSGTPTALNDGTGSDGTVIAGSTTPTLTLSNFAADRAGYEYEAKFTDAASSSTSTQAATVYADSNLYVVTPSTSEAAIQGYLSNNNQSNPTPIIVQFAPGTYSTWATPLNIYADTTIEGSPITTSQPTVLTFVLPITNPGQQDFDGNAVAPWAFDILGNSVTITGLDVTSNLGIAQMRQNSSYSSITIEDNEFQFGSADGSTDYIYYSSEIFGINDPAPSGTTNLELRYNKWVNSPNTRCWVVVDPFDSDFDNNLYANVRDGGQLNGTFDNVSFDDNYATGLQETLQEGNISSASGFEAIGNVASDWQSYNTSSWGLSLPSNSDAPPNGWPVTISQNYIQLAGLNGNPIAGDLSAAALEIGGGPVTCEDNTVGVASNAPEAIMVSTPDSILGDTTQVENQCYGEPLTGPQGPNGLAIQGEAGGNWDTAIVGGNSSLAAMDTAAPVPTNTFAGPAYYPGAPTTFNNNWTAP